MKHNMGTADRIIRALVAIVFAYLIFTGSVGGVLSVILGIFAIMLLGTSIAGYCPPYALLGIRTCRCDDHKEDTTAAV